MKINSKSIFNQRPSLENKKEIVSKTFIACEGEKTEIIYLSRIIEILNLPYHYLLNPKCSNPKKILDEIMVSIGNGHFEITYEIVYSRVEKLMVSNNCFDSKAKKLSDRFLTKNNLKPSDIIDENIAFKYISIILGSTSLIDSAKLYLDEFIKDGDFIKGVDRLYLVSDRDSKSYTEKQCIEVINKCNENGFQYFLTNPCVEFFFMLHWSDCLEYNKQDLLNNRKINGKTFCYTELKKMDSEYKKNKINVDWYFNHFNVAKKNSTSFESELKELIHKAGSNLFNLIDILINEKR